MLSFSDLEKLVGEEVMVKLKNDMTIRGTVHSVDDQYLNIKLEDTRVVDQDEYPYKFSKRMKVSPGSGGGQKWTALEHNGVIFPPPYKPHGVKMLYNGQPVDLTSEQEEVATMFAMMKDTDYAGKQTFIDNFFTDWRKILGKNHIIKKFELCDFTPIYEWHLERRKRGSK